MNLFAVADRGAAPEPDIARDLLRRALPLGAVLVAVAALGWGADGAGSAALAVGLVCVNFAAAAASLAWAARISLALVMGVALIGYLVRIAAVGGIVLAVSGQPWVEPVPLGLVLVAAHLGLLFWELRYVSASLAHPGLVPSATKERISQ